MKPIYLLLTVLSIIFSNSLVASGLYTEPPPVYRDVELQQQLKIKRERERAAWELEERRIAEEQARAAEERRIAEEQARAAREPEETRAAVIKPDAERYSTPITNLTPRPSYRSSTSIPSTSTYPSSSQSSGTKDVYVRGYTRKDGTYVRPHYRSRPRN